MAIPTQRVTAAGMAATLTLFAATAWAEHPAAELDGLVTRETLAALAAEVSGVAAKRNLDQVTQYHRTRGSRQFRAAAEHIHRKAELYGLESTMVEYPADGETFFGTQKSRLAWEADFAELWELDAQGQRVRRLADWDAMPLSLAQDSVSGAAVTSLVDIGAGVQDSDYAGMDIAGKLVLTSSQPGAVAQRAVGDGGAVGIVSYAPNQKSAWWLENDRLVRWGHLDGFSPVKTFAFMISLAEARALRDRLAGGETIMLDARVEARLERGRHSVVTAVIPGVDAQVGGEEIVLSCHLDHPRPGANDNASGCVAILEAARALAALIARGDLPAPRRTLRFLWPPEIEGSMMYLASLPSTDHIRANVHLDMVGGNHSTRAVSRISGGPISLPSFQSDVGHAIGRFVNDQTDRHASGEHVDFPLVSPEGSRGPYQALLEGIDLGSDHEVFNDSSFSIPGIYLHDWPDRYIHTNFDTAARIDPTKLKRAAFIAALQSWILANFDRPQVDPTLVLLRHGALERARDLQARRAELGEEDWQAAARVWLEVERRKARSIAAFAELPAGSLRAADAWIGALGDLIGLGKTANVAAGPVYRRNPELRGPMSVFGYNFQDDHLTEAGKQKVRLGYEQAYEALNLADGRRSVREIHQWLQAEFGPLPLQDVADYLDALAGIGVLELQSAPR